MKDLQKPEGVINVKVKYQNIVWIDWEPGTGICPALLNVGPAYPHCWVPE